MGKTPINQFFDINKLPPEEGILVFPISMSKISTSQNAKKCFDYMEHFTFKKKSKIIKPHVGLNFIYGDYLYLHSQEKASKLRKKFVPLILSHKHNFLNILKKNEWYIEKAFAFSTWSQLLLEAKDFTNYFGTLKKIYAKEKEFQKHIRDDLKLLGRTKLDENQLNFFLEEILVLYLISKGRIKLYNEFVDGHEKWILICYPGIPLKSEIYLHQKNPFKLSNPKNKLENSYYDLKNNILYDYDRVDLKTLKL